MDLRSYLLSRVKTSVTETPETAMYVQLICICRALICLIGDFHLLGGPSAAADLTALFMSRNPEGTSIYIHILYIYIYNR